MDTATHERHPLSAAFGDMNIEDRTDLRESMERHGTKLMEPIVLYEGQILDGWHRYRIADELGMELRYQQLSPQMDPIQYVIAKNAARRHLTQSQKAAAVVRLHEWKPTGDQTGAEGAATVEEMAQSAGVSERTIQQAKKAEEGGLGDQVISGEMSAAKAASQLEETEEEPKPKKQTALQRKRAELAEAQAKHKELEETLASQATEVEELRSRVGVYEMDERGDQQGIAMELRNRNAEIRSLNGSLGQLQTKLRDCEAAGKRKDARIRALEKQVKDLTDELEAASESQPAEDPVEETTATDDDIWED